VWDLAHIGNYAEIWLLRALSDATELRPGLDHIYDAFRHNRASRTALPLLGPVEARGYLRDVRGRALDVLTATDPGLLAAAAAATAPHRTRLLSGSFVYGMVIQHEHQHDETMLATLQLREGPPVLAET
ncbi:DinB family protein, partial [Frankia sp. EI5c]|uniref:DinB family protein n=1 Tax=Frankia sp. EI5c TaxID=683316 RepID=UPI001F5B6F75